MLDYYTAGWNLRHLADNAVSTGRVMAVLNDEGGATDNQDNDGEDGVIAHRVSALAQGLAGVYPHHPNLLSTE